MATEFRKEYTDNLDEALVAANPYADLFAANAGMLQWLQKAKEVKVPKFDIEGPVPYTAGGGYNHGKFALEYETVEADYDVARAFDIDPVQDMDTDHLIKKVIMPEYVRTKDTPNLAAYITMKLAQTENIGTDTAALDTAAKVRTALRAATNAMDNANVPGMLRHLYIRPDVIALIEDQETTQSKAVLARFDKITRVSPSVFYSKITQYDGTTQGQTGGGYVKAEDGLDVNFIVVYEPAVIAGAKYRSLKYVDKAYNVNGDSDVFAPRTVAYCKVKENQVNGVYVHLAPAANADDNG